MNLSATLDGEVVTIVGVVTNGSNIDIAYVDASSILKVVRKYFTDSNATTLATSVTVN